MTGINDSESAQLLLSILVQLLFQLPVIAIAAVGIVLAVRNWRKHPNTSRAALIAFTIVIVMNVVGTFLAYWLPISVYRETNSAAALGWLNVGLSFVSMITGIITWVLVLMAIFKWRGPEEVAEQAGERRPYDVAATPYGAKMGKQG
jgi:magnesium-transporting ATPase (P-type)